MTPQRAELIPQETTVEQIDTLERHPDNPRRGATPAIIESIRTNGFYGAVLAQRSTRRILAGNHRAAAAQAAGLTAIPVTWLDVTDAQARRILLADNSTSDRADYDDQALADLLTAVHATPEGLTGTGYDDHDLVGLLDHLTEPFTPEPGAITRPEQRHTPDTVAAAGEKLAAQYAAGKELHPAMCPNCGHEFYVD